jgi:hypothetical protein
LKVNILEYRQTDSKGKELNFPWVTSILISTANVEKIAKREERNGKIENETFNTLKNLGNNFERNYGHGKKNLSTILCLLMMLAFLVDQVQEICCSLFQMCRKFNDSRFTRKNSFLFRKLFPRTPRRISGNRFRKFAGTYRELWETMRTLFRYARFSNWENFYLMLCKAKPLNTS